MLYGHDCAKACYLCLKHYRNQMWHPLFDKDLARDILISLSGLDPVPPEKASYGAGREMVVEMIKARAIGSDDTFGRYPKGKIEEVLKVAMERLGITDGLREYEVRDDDGRLITVPDFAWPSVKLAVFCDGYAYHGDPDTLELDAKKRNFLQAKSWAVLTFWGRTLLKDSESCAQQISPVLRSRT